MSGPRSKDGATLDPDVLAELEREQEFLLRSLDDLDAEHDAGDLDDTDHAALGDDYTRRLAEVSRSIKHERTAFSKLDSRLSSQQRVLTVLAVLIVAVLAGIFLSRASGFRSPNDTTSGDIRRSSVTLLAEADTLTREGRWPEAIEVYDEVLNIAPSNAEALTYRGWLTARTGEPEAGLLDLTEAVAVDETFPDARVFSAILLDDAQRFDEAAAQLAALDTLQVPPEIQGLVSSSNLRASVAAGQIAQRFSEPSAAVDLTQVAASLEDVAQAGNILAPLDGPLAFKVFSAVLDEDPDNVVSLVGKGQFLASADFLTTEGFGEEGLELLDRAVALEPLIAEVRLFRAQARAIQGDLVGARADLDAIDASTLSGDYTVIFDELAAALN